MTLPVIDEWMLQWYVYVPGLLKVNEKVPPAWEPESKPPPFVAVTVWCVQPALNAQVTLVPVLTGRLDGVNAKLVTEMSPGDCPGHGGRVVATVACVGGAVAGVVPCGAGGAVVATPPDPAP